MRANKIYIEKAIQNISVYLVQWIQKEYQCNSEIALQKLMTTFTYAALIDEQTKLFSESKEYVLDMLISEAENNLQAWMEI